MASEGRESWLISFLPLFVVCRRARSDSCLFQHLFLDKWLFLSPGWNQNSVRRGASIAQSGQSEAAAGARDARRDGRRRRQRLAGAGAGRHRHRHWHRNGRRRGGCRHGAHQGEQFWDAERVAFARRKWNGSEFRTMCGFLVSEWPFGCCCFHEVVEENCEADSDQFLRSDHLQPDWDSSCGGCVTYEPVLKHGEGNNSLFGKLLNGVFFQAVCCQSGSLSSRGWLP